MTAGGMVKAFPRAGQLKPEVIGDWFIAAVRMLRPSDGWMAVVLLLLNLMVVAWSVDRSDWVNTPNLALIILPVSMATGLLFARLPLWGAVGFPAGMGVGVLVVVWQMTSFQAGESSVADAGQLWDRLVLWFEAARSGNINIDQVPFAVGLSSATWLMGYLGIWLFARHRNFWGVFILGGVGLLSNLTYLPPDAAKILGLYLFTALLLVARVQAVRRRQEWQSRNMSFDENLGYLSWSDSFLIAGAVLVTAFFILPTGNKVEPAHGAYNFMRSPMQLWEDDFNRLFAGLPARRPTGYRIWGDVMAFQGPLNPTSAEVLNINSPVPMYWKARTYGTYTAKGWVSEDTVLESMDWTPSFTHSRTELARTEVSYTVTPKYSSPVLFAGPQPLAANREVLLESYDSPTYNLDLTKSQSVAAFPDQLTLATVRLQEIIRQQGRRAPDLALAQALPPQFHLLEVFRNNDAVQGVLLAEMLPERPDVLALRSPGGKIKSGDSYQITSSISLASPGQLRVAGTRYPTWVVDRYTQLPTDLPQRVRDLASKLTAGEVTPYGKALAIEDYLESVPYDLGVDAPPFNGDGVDHFLFTLKRGYSEYFASAMTVMLRSVGVPSRLATGYTFGDEVPDQNTYVVKDSHSHAWVEVYFPRYGWILFEPTPGRVLPQGFHLVDDESANRVSLAGELSQIDNCYAGHVEFDLCPEIGDLTRPEDVFPGSAGWTGKLVGLLPWIFGLLGGVLLLIGSIVLFWRRYMMASENPRAAYRRLAVLGALSAVGPAAYQTPFQYRKRLEGALPARHQEFSVLINAYVRSRYGAKEVPDEERGELTAAWLRLRLPLLLRIFHRRML